MSKQANKSVGKIQFEQLTLFDFLDQTDGIKWQELREPEKK